MTRPERFFVAHTHTQIQQAVFTVLLYLLYFLHGIKYSTGVFNFAFPVATRTVSSILPKLFEKWAHKDCNYPPFTGNRQN